MAAQSSAPADGRFMLLKAWRERYFCEGSRPDPRSVRAAIDDARLPGMQMMGQYYVDVRRFEQMVSRRHDSKASDALLDKITG